MKLKIMAIVALGGVLIACTQPEPLAREVFDPSVVPVPNSYGSKVHTLDMRDGTTCYVATREGHNSISCLRK